MPYWLVFVLGFISGQIVLFLTFLFINVFSFKDCEPKDKEDGLV
jgi:hypothetical protein